MCSEFFIIIRKTVHMCNLMFEPSNVQDSNAQMFMCFDSHDLHVVAAVGRVESGTRHCCRRRRRSRNGWIQAVVHAEWKERPAAEVS